MSAYVVDASVVCEWFWPEQHSERALAVLGHDLHAPALLVAEFASGVWRRVTGGQISPAEAPEAVLRFDRQPAELHELGGLMEPALELAMDTSHPAHDCFYLALALRERCQLISADRRLYELGARGLGTR